MKKKIIEFTQWDKLLAQLPGVTRRGSYYKSEVARAHNKINCVVVAMKHKMWKLVIEFSDAEVVFWVPKVASRETSYLKVLISGSHLG